MATPDSVRTGGHAWYWIHTDASSYRAITPQKVLSNAEKNEKKKYLSVCEEKHELHPTLFYH